MAGVALGHIYFRFAWQAWHWSHPPSFCVAGVALMALGGALGPVLVAGDAAHFAWQAWHLATSTFVLCGRPHFALQAWHLWHWAGSGGALGLVLVAGDAAALCVAGVSLGDICLRFAWQA